MCRFGERKWVQRCTRRLVNERHGGKSTGYCRLFDMAMVLMPTAQSPKYIVILEDPSVAMIGISSTSRRRQNKVFLLLNNQFDQYSLTSSWNWIFHRFQSQIGLILFCSLSPWSGKVETFGRKRMRSGIELVLHALHWFVSLENFSTFPS